MKRLLFFVIVIGLFSMAFSATRVGPVSQYGELKADKNSSGKGRIYGSCQGVRDGAEVQVRGMSLYWSLLPDAVEYWSAEGVTSMVKEMKAQVVRAAMAPGNEDWKNGYLGYGRDPETQKKLMNTVVQAAIDNDIYVIIDWHSHDAHLQTQSSVGFFTEMAQKWGKYDNVIFELFNEPKDISWNQVREYANEVIKAIRKYSDNLIIVGNPYWDQNPQMAIGNEVTDPAKNTAYTLHYYANSHCWDGKYDGGGDCEGTKAVRAMNAGLSVFISEWGTNGADGKGTPNYDRNNSWQEFVNKHKLSTANWSGSRVGEGSAAFLQGSTKTSLNFSESGTLVKKYLSNNPETYIACKVSVNSSSSKANLSSGSIQSSSSQKISSSSTTLTAINANDFDMQIHFSFHGRSFQISGLKEESNIDVDVFDMQGSPIFRKHGATREVSLASVPSGTYIVRVRSGAALRFAKVQVH